MTGFEVRLAERRDLEVLMEIEKTQFPEPWTTGMMLDELERTDTRRYTSTPLEWSLVMNAEA